MTTRCISLVHAVHQNFANYEQTLNRWGLKKAGPHGNVRISHQERVSGTIGGPELLFCLKMGQINP